MNSSGVTIRNLTIKNANFNGDGGAIYFGVAGTVENCTFIGNKANGGGAMCEGYAINCRFIENHASNGCGGAINGYNHKSINCTFISNFAYENGGALSGGEAHNCSFISNLASHYGGATSECKVYNCNFTGNSAISEKGSGAMYGGTAFLCIFETSSDTLYNTNIPTFTVSKSLFIFDSGDKLLFNLTCDNKNYDGYNTTITLTQDGNPAGVYYALSGSDEGWSAELRPGDYVATLSLGQYAENPITVEIITGMKDDPTYYGLKSEICEGGNINLTKSYYNYTGGNTIEIKNSGIINGNGAVIDMAGSAIRAFTVSAYNVTIRNLTIKNANYNGYGGAIYFSQSCSVLNCNFTNNTADRHGGAIYMGAYGNITNCNFTNNQVISGHGGAVYFNGAGSVINCNFTNNSAKDYGGAIMFVSTGTVTNCNFTNNSAYNRGGAIYFNSLGSTHTVTNCNFTNNQAPNAVVQFTLVRVL